MMLAETDTTLGALVWAFVNSPVGVSIVGGAFAFVLARLFTAQPSWQRTYDEYGGLFFDAVRHAERSIPDNTPNRAAQRADSALKFLLRLEPKLASKPKVDLMRGLTEAHDTIKANTNGAA